jgi:hypothetical protein
VPDAFEVASAWLGAKRKVHLARPVTYRRGAEAVEVDATIGRSLFEAPDAYGVVVVTESRDFLIAAADLVLGGEPALPAAGDRVEELQDGNILTYEVMAPGTEPAWRYSDPYHRTLRIHTKLVAKEG